jgi:hypothetical protein
MANRGLDLLEALALSWVLFLCIIYMVIRIGLWLL